MVKSFVVQSEKGETWQVEVTRKGENRFLICIGEEEQEVELEKHRELYCMRWKGHSHIFTVERKKDRVLVRLDGKYYPLLLWPLGKERESSQEAVQDGRFVLKAPMPGVVKKVLCQKGERVCKDQALVVMEAMKMEISLKAEYQGRVREISVQVGDSVSEGEKLVEVEVED